MADDDNYWFNVNSALSSMHCALCTLHYPERLFDRSRQHCLVADLDDRTLKQARKFHHRRDDLGFRRLFRQTQILERRIAFSQNLERRKSGLFQKRPQLIFAQRIDKVIDSFKIDVVFTKQRGQITARRSGRFFVNSDVVRHKLPSFPSVRAARSISIDRIRR